MSLRGPQASNTLGSAVRLVVVADVRLYRDGLAAALSRFTPLHVVAATSGPDALRLVQQVVPDVAVVDISNAAGTALVSQLRALELPTRVIAFGVDEDRDAIIRCGEAGASGYVTLNASLDELAAAIERVAAGELECAPHIAAELFRRLSHRTIAAPAAPEAPTGLTRREQEVLTLLRRGLSNKEIGAALHIAEATVKNHVHHLLEKLNVTTRAQAAAYAAAEFFPAPGARRVLPAGI